MFIFMQTVGIRIMVLVSHELQDPNKAPAERKVVLALTENDFIPSSKPCCCQECQPQEKRKVPLAWPFLCAQSSDNRSN